MIMNIHLDSCCVLVEVLPNPMTTNTISNSQKESRSPFHHFKTFLGSPGSGSGAFSWLQGEGSRGLQDLLRAKGKIGPKIISLTIARFLTLNTSTLTSSVSKTKWVVLKELSAELCSVTWSFNCPHSTPWPLPQENDDFTCCGTWNKFKNAIMPMVKVVRLSDVYSLHKVPCLKLLWEDWSTSDPKEKMWKLPEGHRILWFGKDL